jgi:hypothetical protein
MEELYGSTAFQYVTVRNKELPISVNNVVLWGTSVNLA